jgi:hypothetical protein
MEAQKSIPKKKTKTGLSLDIIFINIPLDTQPTATQIELKYRRVVAYCPNNPSTSCVGKFSGSLLTHKSLGAIWEKEQ